eukprot:4183869-Pyramimonas_sp.AAC.1
MEMQHMVVSLHKITRLLKVDGAPVYYYFRFTGPPVPTMARVLLTPQAGRVRRNVPEMGSQMGSGNP